MTTLTTTRRNNLPAATFGPTATWGDLAQAYIALKAAYAQCSAQVQAIAQLGAAK